MKAWIGFGISKYYEDLSKNIEEKISILKFDYYDFVIADEMHRKYNGNLNKKILRNINTNLKGIDCSKIISSKELEEIIPIKQVLITYNEHNEFRNEVNSLVKRNRNIKKDEDLEKLAGYVIEEIALIIYFYKKNYFKIGYEEKEKSFDLLAQHFFNIPKNSFLYFENLIK